MMKRSEMNWRDDIDWLYRSPVFGGISFPGHGSSQVEKGQLTALTDTDYLHTLCPLCRLELDNHFIGIRKEVFNDIRGVCPTIFIGEYCPRCELKDLTKIPCVCWGDPTYQFRRHPLLKD